MNLLDLFESQQQCPECGGPAFSDLLLAEKKDACYHKVKATAKVWPSAYASGRLVQCRKKGADNYGNQSEGVAEGLKEMDKTQTSPGRDGDIDWTKKQIHLGPEHVIKAKDVAKHALKALDKTMKKSHADTSKKKGVAEARSPEEFVRQMDKIAATPQTFEVGDWVTIDPNETSGYASSSMIGRIIELYDDEGESMAKIAVGGGSGVQKKLGKGVRSSGTHTVVPTSILQKDDPRGVAEGKMAELEMDLEDPEITDRQFEKMYGMTRKEAREQFSQTDMWAFPEIRDPNRPLHERGVAEAERQPGRFSGAWQILVNGKKVHSFRGNFDQETADRVGVVKATSRGLYNPGSGDKIKIVPVMLDQKQGVAEAINPDITNSAFSHQQQIGDYLYVARYWSQGLKIAAYDGNKLIGQAKFMYHSGWGEPSSNPKYGNPNKFWLESEMTEVHPKYQRQGIMSTMYAYARMLGNTIKASGLQSDEAQAAWASWRQSGDKEHLTKMKAEGVVEAFGPLPREKQQIRLGRHTVDIERVGLDNNYISFAWHDSQGQEHYEEVPVGDLGSYDDLIKKIKQEISHQERQYTDQGVAEEHVEEINWKKAAATGALALGALGGLGASGSAQARVTPGADGQMSPSAAQQMSQQGFQASAEKPGGQMPNQNLDSAEKVERGDNGIIVHYGGKEYKGVLVPKDGPTPRGAKMIRIAQAQMGERGIGNYTTYLLPNGTAHIYKLASQNANEGVAEGDNEKIGGQYDPDDFDAMVQRLKKLAAAGPMNTVYDPQRRVYRNVPVAQQSKPQS